MLNDVYTLPPQASAVLIAFSVCFSGLHKASSASAETQRNMIYALSDMSEYNIFEL